MAGIWHIKHHDIPCPYQNDLGRAVDRTSDEYIPNHVQQPNQDSNDATSGHLQQVPVKLRGDINCFVATFVKSAVPAHKKDVGKTVGKCQNLH